jgi:hypothetical protein
METAWCLAHPVGFSQKIVTTEVESIAKTVKKSNLLLNYGQICLRMPQFGVVFHTPDNNGFVIRRSSIEVFMN